MSLKVTDSDLPSLYQRADSFSLRAQTHHFVALGLYLILLLGGSAIGSDSWRHEFTDLMVLFAFVLALAVLIYLQYWSPETDWYNGRAAAESIKTRAWRWMMCAPPYDREKATSNVSSQFIGDLRSILEDNRARPIPASLGPSESPVTETMKAVRALPVEGRLDVYLEDRVSNQKKFYEKRAISARRCADLWFWLSVLMHGGAITILVCNLKEPNFSMAVGPFATAAAAIATWTQSKKYRELAASYSLTAHEIGLIYGYSESVTDEQALEDFVINSESAFSREHTQWAARRIT